MDDKRRATAQALLDMALEFWKACQDEGQYGAVQWLIGTNGELLIYTRGEYRQALMENIHRLPDAVEHRFETLAQDEEE